MESEEGKEKRENHKGAIASVKPKSPQKLDLDRRAAEDKGSRNASAWLWDIQFASHSSLAGPCVVA